VALQPVAQDGCPGCCSFDCRLTPTPTPQFDAEGRPIYTTSGRFLFVVETKPGVSFLNSGSEGTIVNNQVTGISHGSQRPSLQVVGSMDFGNGSAAVCDGSPNVPPGGVPGFDPPWIDCTSPDLSAGELTLCQSRQPAVTSALQDLACRFNFVINQTVACTKNATGNFAFIAGDASRQYCFQVPLDSELPAGDSVIAAQARDTAGNLGPLKEIVIRVPAAP
jgi:hypothetical protein